MPKLTGQGGHNRAAWPERHPKSLPADNTTSSGVKTRAASPQNRIKLFEGRSYPSAGQTLSDFKISKYDAESYPLQNSTDRKLPETFLPESVTTKRKGQAYFQKNTEQPETYGNGKSRPFVSISHRTSWRPGSEGGSTPYSETPWQNGYGSVTSSHESRLSRDSGVSDVDSINFGSFRSSSPSDPRYPGIQEFQPPETSIPYAQQGENDEVFLSTHTPENGRPRSSLFRPLMNSSLNRDRQSQVSRASGFFGDEPQRHTHPLSSGVSVAEKVPKITPPPFQRPTYSGKNSPFLEGAPYAQFPPDEKEGEEAESERIKAPVPPALSDKANLKFVKMTEKVLMERGFSQQEAHLYVTTWQAKTNENHQAIAALARGMEYQNEEENQLFKMGTQRLLENGYPFEHAEVEVHKAIRKAKKKRFIGRQTFVTSKHLFEEINKLPTLKSQKSPPDWSLEWLQQAGYTPEQAIICAREAERFFEGNPQAFTRWLQGKSDEDTFSEFSEALEVGDMKTVADLIAGAIDRKTLLDMAHFARKEGGRPSKKALAMIQHRQKRFRAKALFQKYGGDEPLGPDRDIKVKAFAELSRFSAPYQKEVMTLLEELLPPAFLAEDLFEQLAGKQVDYYYLMPKAEEKLRDRAAPFRESVLTALEDKIATREAELLFAHYGGYRDIGADHDIMKKTVRHLRDYPASYQQKVREALNLQLNPDDAPPLFQAPPRR
ncbi:MAG: hypothetical protein ACPG5T_01735 [Endozoicomonas sp.]